MITTPLRRILVVAVVLALGIAGGVTYALTRGDDKPCPSPLYASTARVFFVVEPQGSQPVLAAYFVAQRMRSYAALATSRELLVRVIGRLDLQTTPSELASEIRATVVKDTVIVSLQVTDPDPAVAQRIAKAESELYADLVSAVETRPLKATIVDPASYGADPINACRH